MGGTWVTITCWTSLGICDSQLSQEQIFGVLVFLHDFHKSSRSWLGEIHSCGVNWMLWLLMTQVMFSSQETFLERGLDYRALIFTSSILLCCHLLQVESGLQQNLLFWGLIPALQRILWDQPGLELVFSGFCDCWSIQVWNAVNTDLRSCPQKTKAP